MPRYISIVTFPAELNLLQGSRLVTLGGLFLAGLATSFTPCIYPMIPVTAGVLGATGAGQRSRRRTVIVTLVYVLGLALVYASLGLLAGMTGALFGAVSSSPWAYFVFGNLLLLAALAMLDVFTVAAPQRLVAWASRLGGNSLGGAVPEPGTIALAVFGLLSVCACRSQRHTRELV